MSRWAGEGALRVCFLRMHIPLAGFPAFHVVIHLFDDFCLLAISQG